MKKFCQNPLCRCHIDLPDGMQVMRYLEVNGREVNIGRRKIVQTDGTGAGRTFEFCDICANVVAIVFGKKSNT